MFFKIHLLSWAFLTVSAQFLIEDSLSILPQNGLTRSAFSLDGIWKFRLQKNGQNGFTEKWFNTDFDTVDDSIERMPVPSSFNDITERKDIRDFSGWVWYQTKFQTPSVWSLLNQTKNESVLRFGSVNYRCKVWLNGILIAQHVGGHLPFQALVTPLLNNSGALNRLTVAVNNELSSDTLPPGVVHVWPDDQHPGSNITDMHPNFDFFPYSGIHRSVILHCLPRKRIVDLTVRTDVKEENAFVEYSIQTNIKSQGSTRVRVELFDKNGRIVGKTLTGERNIFSLNNVTLWYPFPGIASQKPAYRYQMIIELLENDVLLDRVEQHVGIRRVELKDDGFYVNGFLVYLRGFGRHEDENIRGRGLSATTMIKDFNLMKWTGANSFRTSHYPYSEEIMNEADEQGFLVINEVPAVGLKDFNNPILYEQHIQYVKELIDRDKNRPSVIAWSIANEPSSCHPQAKEYFQKISKFARDSDLMMKRPITAAISCPNATSEVASFSLDFIMLNMYPGWYNHAGYVQTIRQQVKNHIESFGKVFKKPIMISEYGAETIPGFHSDPGTIFSEEYQIELLNEFHFTFDLLRKNKLLIGEHIWNFADFRTVLDDITRPDGNHKGIFTRDRRPKTSASVLRCRYWSLADRSHASIEKYYRSGVTLCPKLIV